MSEEHFETIWNKSEELIASEVSKQPTAPIIEELIAKLALYKALDLNDKIPEEEKQKLKTHLFGKLLIALSKLSFKENVNVYTAMKQAMEELRLSQLELAFTR